MNHNESDHSGALPLLMAEIPDTPIYCTKKGEAIIRGHYHQDWNFVTVKTGDTLDLGDSKLVFIEAISFPPYNNLFPYYIFIIFFILFYRRCFCNKSLADVSLIDKALSYHSLYVCSKIYP